MTQELEKEALLVGEELPRSEEELRALQIRYGYTDEEMSHGLKVCTDPQCPQPVKPMTGRYWDKNKASKDGWNAQCKESRKKYWQEKKHKKEKAYVSVTTPDDATPPAPPSPSPSPQGEEWTILKPKIAGEIADLIMPLRAPNDYQERPRVLWLIYSSRNALGKQRTRAKLLEIIESPTLPEKYAGKIVTRLLEIKIPTAVYNGFLLKKEELEAGVEELTGAYI